MTNKYFEEFVDPFQKGSFIIRAEHYMRYQFACMVLNKHLPKGSAVYDIGCGNGYGSRMFKKAGFAPIGFDSSENLLQEAAKLSDQTIIYHHIDFEKSAISDFVNKNQVTKPTAVVCFEILEHLTSPGTVIRQLHSLMDEHGIIILSVPNGQFEPKKNGKPRNVFHKQLFTKDTLEELITKNGFTAITFYGQPYSNVLLHKARPFIGLLNTISYHSITLFKLFATQVASPKKDKIATSYSFIVIAKNKQLSRGSLLSPGDLLRQILHLPNWQYAE